MTQVINKAAIISAVENIDVIAAMKTGFIEYSNGNCVVPPVGELLFEKENGESHIKYGYIKNGTHYVIKIASGFYDNPKLGIPSSQGMMLVFNQKTGVNEAILLDEGHLTNIRTAAAGALVAQYFAPRKIKAFGIIGTGIQGSLQFQFLQQHHTCKDVWIWDINEDNTNHFKAKFGKDFNIHIAKSTSELASNCNMIVSCTPSQEPLIKACDIKPGTHITAVGSDTPEKQELESEILAMADILISDSLSQSESRGEIFRAVKNGSIKREKPIELGKALQDKKQHRSSDNQISVADLSGVAVQDIMIAKAVLNYIQITSK
jgi:ornithine cyclodeaminase